MEEENKAKYQMESLSFSSVQQKESAEDLSQIEMPLKDPLLEFVSDLAEMDVLDVPEETLDLIKDSIVEGSFEFSNDTTALAEEILRDQSSSAPF